MRSRPSEARQARESALEHPGRILGRIGIGLLALSMLIAACGSPSTSSVTATGKGDKAPLMIGGVYSATGSLAVFGAYLISGLNFYASYTNAHGGIDGHQVDIVMKDDQSQASVGVTVMRELASNPDIVAINGPILPGEAALLAKVALAEQVPLVSSTLSTPNADYNANPYWYRVGWDDAATVSAVLSQLKALHDTRISVLYADDAGGIPGQQAVDQLAPKLGMTVVSQVSYPTGTPNPAVQVLKAKSANPQAYVVWDPDSAPELGLVVRTLRENGASQPVGVPESADGSAFLQAAGSNVSNVYYWGGVAPDDLAPGIQSTIGQAMIAAHIMPSDQELTGYAGGEIIGAAAAAVYKSGETPTRANMNKALQSLHNLATVYGTVNYSTSNHAVPLATVPIIEYKNGKTILVAGHL
jgi:branched-chain amino acid transport system substrate-binding protein